MYVLQVKAGLPCPMFAKIPCKSYEYALASAFDFIKLGSSCKILANGEIIWESE